jgi:hypothetical protein
VSGAARGQTARRIAPRALPKSVARSRLYAGSASGYEWSPDVLPAYNADALPGYLEAPERIVALGKRADVVGLTINAVWGIAAPLGRNFSCPLPGHTGDASMYQDPQSGTWKLRCWCHDEWWTLAEARASLAYGKAHRLKNAESAVWYRRLWHEAALIQTMPVVLPSLPEEASAATRRVVAGFELLVGLRWLTHHGQPVPYTRAFAAAWSGVSEGTAGKAITAILESGCIRQVSECQVGARRFRLFLPASHLTIVEGRDA